MILSLERHADNTRRRAALRTHLAEIGSEPRTFGCRHKNIVFVTDNRAIDQVVFFRRLELHRHHAAFFGVGDLREFEFFDNALVGQHQQIFLF